MRLRTVMIQWAIILMTSGVVAGGTAMQQPAQKAPTADSPAGEWAVAFTLQGITVPGTLILRVDGDKVTGAVYSQHTGAGTLRDGLWADNKLSFTMEFTRHESIALTGKLLDGKLSGEFRTEGMQGTWEAKRR
jgi:hypothetical protein